MITCPNCQTQNEAGAIFCDNCGADLRNMSLTPENAPVAAPAPAPAAPPQEQNWGGSQPGGVVCPACNLTNVPGASFCENCGAALPTSAAPMVTPPPAPAQPPQQAPVQPISPPPAPEQPPQVAPAQPEPVATPAPTPSPQPPAPVSTTGQLVLQASNTSLPLPAGKDTIVIGREDPVSGIFPEVDLDPYGAQEAGVSRQHARLTIQGGQVLIEDLNSANGTLVNRQRLAPNQPRPLQNGDEIRLGRLALVYTTG